MLPRVPRLLRLLAVALLQLLSAVSVQSQCNQIAARANKKYYGHCPCSCQTVEGFSCNSCPITCVGYFERCQPVAGCPTPPPTVAGVSWRAACNSVAAGAKCYGECQQGYRGRGATSSCTESGWSMPVNQCVQAAAPALSYMEQSPDSPAVSAVAGATTLPTVTATTAGLDPATSSTALPSSVTAQTAAQPAAAVQATIAQPAAAAQAASSAQPAAAVQAAIAQPAAAVQASSSAQPAAAVQATTAQSAAAVQAASSAQQATAAQPVTNIQPTTTPVQPATGVQQTAAQPAAAAAALQPVTAAVQPSGAAQATATAQPATAQPAAAVQPTTPAQTTTSQPAAAAGGQPLTQASVQPAAAATVQPVAVQPSANTVSTGSVKPTTSSTTATVCSTLPKRATSAKGWPRNCRGAAVGATCTAQCKLGYTGEAVARCLHNGKWRTSVDTCIRVNTVTTTAGRTSLQPAITPTTGGTSVPVTAASATTSPTIATNAAPTVVAAGSDEKLAVCAGLPEGVANSKGWPQTCAGSQGNLTCTAECAEGYDGEVSSTCTTTSVTAVWSTPINSCKKVCNGPPPGVNGVSWDTTCNIIPPGAACNGTCPFGYTGAGYTALCGPDGVWQLPTGQCDEVLCQGRPPKTTGVRWPDCTGHRVGESCVANACAKGFNGTGAIANCMPDGSWYDIWTDCTAR